MENHAFPCSQALEEKMGIRLPTVLIPKPPPPDVAGNVAVLSVGDVTVFGRKGGGEDNAVTMKAPMTFARGRRTPPIHRRHRQQ